MFSLVHAVARLAKPAAWTRPTLASWALRGRALSQEAHRLYSVLDRRLAQHEFVADDYSVADIAIWPWVSRYEWQTVDLNAYANVKRWYTVIASRPAVQRGYKVPKTSAKFLCRELESGRCCEIWRNSSARGVAYRRESRLRPRSHCFSQMQSPSITLQHYI